MLMSQLEGFTTSGRKSLEPARWSVRVMVGKVASSKAWSLTMKHMFSWATEETWFPAQFPGAAEQNAASSLLRELKVEAGRKL